MKAKHWRDLGLLFALALAVRLLTACLLRQPGYMDAYYYAVGAQQLASGQGFAEPFVWNYLNPPDGLPHPGYRYWMPLTAVLGWLGIVAAQSIPFAAGSSFFALQVPFVLTSALLPVVAYEVAWDMTARRRHAWLAGLLAIFPGFYAHVLVLPDNFAAFALTGSLCLWAAGRGLGNQRPLWFGAAGLAAGFGHLTRADGLLLLGVGLVAALLPRHQGQTRRLSSEGATTPPRNQTSPARNRDWVQTASTNTALLLAGYLLIMIPWFLRNWLVFGTPLPAAGTKTLFLTTYDDMFAYGRPLTLQAYLAWGWQAILESKLEALLLNLQRLWVENFLIFLLPFSAVGLWQLRRRRLLWPFFLYLPLLFLVMTLGFTFPGMRGGLFHSGGALLPFLFAAAGPGLEGILRWVARRVPGWHVRNSWRVFGVGLVGLAAMVTGFALVRAGAFSGEWNQQDWGYADIGDWLTEQGGDKAVVMVGNAPGFTWHTGHYAVAVPNEPLDTILLVADRYAARYLVLDSTRPRTTDALYGGQVSHPRLSLRYSVGPDERPWQVYEVVP